MPLPAKPPINASCNGCGHCCRNSICPIGKTLFPGAQAPCPGLLVLEDRTMCEAVLIEQSAGALPLAALLLGVGEGCCSSDETTSDKEMDSFYAQTRRRAIPRSIDMDGILSLSPNYRWEAA